MRGSGGSPHRHTASVRARAVVDIIPSGWIVAVFTVFPGGIAEVVDAALHKLMHGYASRETTYTGLWEKCPAIAFTDRTVIADDEMTGASTRRRTHACTFDSVLYLLWCFGGEVWLEEDPTPKPDNTTNPSTLLQSFRSPSAVAEGQKTENLCADLRTKSNHTQILGVRTYSNLVFQILYP